MAVDTPESHIDEIMKAGACNFYDVVRDECLLDLATKVVNGDLMAYIALVLAHPQQALLSMAGALESTAVRAGSANADQPDLFGL